MRDRAEPFKTTSAPAVKRRRSEGITLAVAVTFAVGLGVAVGIWINARLAPTASSDATRPARLVPAASAPAPAARPSPCDGCETSPVSEATPARVAAVKADEAAPETDSVAPTGVARAASTDASAAPRPADEVANASTETQGATGSEAVAAASPDPSRPVAWEVGSSPKAGARANVERGAAPSGARAADREAQAQPVPCALYTSANTLSVRVGGAAPLILGGPGVGVRVNVSTPNSSELAVIYEGPAGQNGWLRYSIRSVGRAPGSYTVRVSSPCGSQTIMVTVKGSRQ